jgi:hypothetical protein
MVHFAASDRLLGRERERRWVSFGVVSAMSLAMGACGGASGHAELATLADGASVDGDDVANGGDSAASDGGATSTPAPDALGSYAIDGFLKSEETNMPIAGSTVCLIDAPTVCAATDASGAYLLHGLSPNGSGIIASAPGYAPGLFPLTTTSDVHAFTIFIRTPMRVDALASSVGATFGSTGAIHFEGRDAANAVRAGVSVSVAASSGAIVSYYVAPGKLSTAATATGTMGDGYIFGVPEGTATLTFNAPSSTCAREAANDWPPASGSAGTTMTIPIRAGAVTRAAVMCP